MSDPVLSKLSAVEGDLSEQVESLESELNRIRGQRDGLRTVIDMFEDGGASSPASAKSLSDSAKADSPKADSSKADSSKADSPKAGSAKADSPKRRAGRPPKQTKTENKTTAKATEPIEEKKTAAKKPKSTQKSGRKKKDGRAANWQKYVQDSYRDIALPESVSSILQSQPDEIFSIADVMTAIFQEDMPHTSYLKARNRISNILSAGARDGTWYRGRNGRYSQSESVTKN